jgi:two-component system NarL family response regulator
MSEALRIIIADDHTLFRQGLKSMLVNVHPDVTVVAEVESVSEITKALAEAPCDILLLDIQMDRNALADIRELARQVQIVVVTAGEQLSDALAAIRAGARAVVFKRFAVERLMEAVRTVRQGHVWVPPELQSELAAQMLHGEAQVLTVREQEIVRLVALGLQNPEIAQRLGLKDVTVKSHINRIFHKLDIRDRVGLAVYALRLGLAGINERAR